jgi:hypothetical protein
VDHGDRRVPRAFDTGEHLDDTALGITGGAAPLLHLLEVHARAERRASAAHDHHPDLAVGVQLLEALAKRGEERGVHGVALAGAIERDGRNAAVHRAEDFV